MRDEACLLDLVDLGWVVVMPIMNLNSFFSSIFQSRLIPGILSLALAVIGLTITSIAWQRQSASHVDDYKQQVLGDKEIDCQQSSSSATQMTCH